MSAVSGAVLGDIYRWLMSNGFAILKTAQTDGRASGIGRISNRLNLNSVLLTELRLLLNLTSVDGKVGEE